MPPTLPQFYESMYRLLRPTQSAATLVAYRLALKHWSDDTGDPPLTEITERSMAQFQAGLLKRGLRPASVNSYLRHLKAVIRLAADCDAPLIDRAPRIRMLREPKHVPLALTVEEFTKILECASRWPGTIGDILSGTWWKALLMVAWDTGLRHRALLLLTTTDWTANPCGISCQAETQKDREGQWFPLPPDTAAAVEPLLAGGRRGLLFPREVAIETIGRWFRRILDTSGIIAPHGSGMRFHRLRRSKASYTKLAGGDATAALGHSTSSVTARYFDPRICLAGQQNYMPRPTLA